MKKAGKEEWNYSLDFYFFWVNFLVFIVVSVVSALVSAVLYHFFILRFKYRKLFIALCFVLR